MRKQFTLEEHLAHPDWKVELDCGVEVEIFATDKPGDYPVVCMAKKDGAIPFRCDRNGIAYHFPEGANYSNLYLVTPEPEFTRFEKKVAEIIFNRQNEDDWGMCLKLGKEYAKEFLDLARQEIIDEWSMGLNDVQDRSGKAYSDGYSTGRARGKAEALKDLPRWRNMGGGACGGGEREIALIRTAPGYYFLSKSIGPRDTYLMLTDLEKLPKEQEDEK